MAERKFIFLEVARTFAMARIILAHVNDYCYLRGPGDKALWSVAISAIVSFAVPTLFIISGFLLGRSSNILAASLDPKLFWKRKAVTLLLPFITWNIIYMIITETVFNWNKGIKILFYLSTGYMHLYFVFLLLQFFLIYTLIYPFLKRKRLKVKQLLMVGGLLTVVFYTISDILLWYNDSSDNHFFEWHYGKICFAWSIFIFWGIYLGENKDRLDLLKRHTLFFFGALVTFVIYLWETNRKFIIIGDNSRQYFLLSGLPFQFLAATFLLVFLYQVDLSLTNDRWYRPLYNWLANLGKDTFGIYLSHNAILLGILSLWNCFPLPNAIGVKIPAVFAVTALTSWAFVRLIGLLNPLYVRTILLGAR